MTEPVPVRPQRSIRRSQGPFAERPALHRTNTTPAPATPIRTAYATRLSSPPTIHHTPFTPTTTTYVPDDPFRPTSLSVTVGQFPPVPTTRPLSFDHEAEKQWYNQPGHGHNEKTGSFGYVAASGPSVIGSERSFGMSLRRTLSRVSNRSYMSNLSKIHQRDYSRFGKSKVAFLLFNTVVSGCLVRKESIYA